jgi:hypothetical protein
MAVKGQGEFARSSDPEMTLEISIGVQTFEVSATWKPLPNGGWVAANLG